MKKQALAIAIATLTTAGFAFAAANDDNVMRKQEDGTYVVNTTTLVTNVRGYKGATPLEVHIKKDKVVKVVALKNNETPQYFAQVTSKMLPKYNDKKHIKSRFSRWRNRSYLLVKSSKSQRRSSR